MDKMSAIRMKIFMRIIEIISKRFRSMPKLNKSSTVKSSRNSSKTWKLPLTQETRERLMLIFFEMPSRIYELCCL
jgi:hypothetical protein